MEIDVKKIREQLPHGSCKLIAKKQNLEQTTISAVLTGRIKKGEMFLKVVNGALEYIKEYKAKETQIEKAISEALKD